MNGWLAVSSVSGFLAVALGAFGAHGLSARLAGLADSEKRLGWWQTAAQYHLVHAVMLGVVSLVVLRVAAARYAGFAFVAGSVLFSGSLYAMALGAPRFFGAITPLGGVCFLAGWAVLAWCGLRR